MRLMIDTMIALLLVGVLAGLLWQHRAEQNEVLEVQAVHDAMSALYEESLYHGTDPDALTSAGFPKTISIAWFEGRLPVNVKVPTSQPWLDVAPEGDATDHPPDPVIVSSTQAGFWYNPHRGVFRARVKQQFTEQETIDLYNQLNHTALKSLVRDLSPARRPVSLADSHLRPSVMDVATDPMTPSPNRRTISSADPSNTTAPAPRRPTLSDIKLNR